MRFPRSLGGPWLASVPAVIKIPVGLLAFASLAYSAPNVVWPFTLFTTGLVVYAMGVNVIALVVERRRAQRRGLPEPGTDGTLSLAESVVFLAIALPFAVAAVGLTVYGVVNELGGNGREGGAGLALGAMALFMAIVMGLGALPIVIARRYR
jgi:hypothetical protein